MILRNPHFQPVQFSTTAHFYHDLKVLLGEPADLERVPRHAVVYKVVHDLAEEDEHQKYNNNDGIMIATGTGKVLFALNILNDKDWFILLLVSCLMSKDLL